MKRLAITVALLVASTARADGLGAKYPGDKGISKDPAVLFADDFESGDLKKWDDTSGSLAVTADRPNAGAKCATVANE